jgi:hypothetical protein
LPFPGHRNLADERLLIGGYRPESDIPGVLRKVSDGSKSQHTGNMKTAIQRPPPFYAFRMNY